MRTEKILLICDNASFHKAKWLSQWVENKKTWLRIEFLPPYSPDFNPIEFIHNKCWRTKGDLKEYLKATYEKISSCTDSIKSLMNKENEGFEKLCQYYEVPSTEQFEIAL
ncbi:MAG: transposase [bacterium]